MIQRGEIYYADMSTAFGSEQGGVRPVLVIQNNIGNLYSPTTIVTMITSKNKKELPTHVKIKKDEKNGLRYDSTVILEQIRTIDKSRILNKIGTLSESDCDRVLEAMKVSLAI